MGGGSDFWEYIKTYEELIKVGRTHIGLLFDLYQSREGQLGWSRVRLEYHDPCINPLEEVYADSVKRADVSQMLFKIVDNELKRPVGSNSLDILLNNEPVVLKILNDIQAYNILKSSGVK
jgi:hypothetical protein